MVDAKGNGDASTSSPKTHNDMSAPVENIVSGLNRSSPVEFVIPSESENKVENIMEEVRDEENTTIVVRNEENPVEEENGELAISEKEEKSGDGAMDEEEEKSEREDDDDDDEEEEEERKEKIAMEEEKIAMEEEKNSMKEAEDDKSKESNKEKVDANSNEKTRKPRKRNIRKKLTQGADDKLAGKDEDKPEPSGKKQASKRVDSMGMIFMCSSKTKQDCYRYKILGLPASKKDIVQKVYKGMRLFLFDVDLRLMYGIYKAAGPGGSNIEPKAFKSAFPSQVKFTVCEDCLPLAEEKFKKVLKDNYYSRNKFDCQLNSEHVKKLCKLFISSGKVPKAQKVGRSLVAESHVAIDRGRIRRRGRDEESGSALGPVRRPREISPRIHRREYSPVERRPRRPHKRRPIECRPHERSPREHPVVYRDVLPHLPRGQRLPVEAPGPLHAYEPVLEHRNFRFVDFERRHEYQRYIPYREREAPPYREPVYSTGLRGDYYPEYRTTTVDLPTEYCPSAGLPAAEYHSSASLLAEYRAAGVPAEHHAPAGFSREYRRLTPPSEYRASAGGLRDYHSLRSVHRY